MKKKKPQAPPLLIYCHVPWARRLVSVLPDCPHAAGLVTQHPINLTSLDTMYQLFTGGPGRGLLGNMDCEAELMWILSPKARRSPPTGLVEASTWVPKKTDLIPFTNSEHASISPFLLFWVLGSHT